MKMSNKILLGLLVVVFTIPFLLASTLKGKISKGEFTVEKYNDMTNRSMHAGSFTSFKVVKVVAPNPELLRCRLKLSDDMDYSYSTYGTDSISVLSNNDTLYITYVPEVGDDHNNINIKINLPTISNLVVDGSTVIIDSLPTAQGIISVTLLNNGVVKDGTKNNDESARQAPAKGGRKEDLQAAKSVQLNAKSGNTGFLKVVQVKKVEGTDPDMKDLLMHSLLYRI